MGFWGLTALVFGMVVGSGIFDLPQNFAASAGPAAVAIAWAITAAGMLLLVGTFKTLADRRPDLNAGIYQYAQAGYGNYLGFNMGWGYWLCTGFANVTYAVMLNDCFGAFFPVMLDHGWALIIFGSVLIWTMFLLVSNGIRTVKTLNDILAVVKVAVILLIIVILFLNIKAGMFTADFWGNLGDLGGLGEQVKNTMLVTLWCFIGIEGAVMMSARARNPKKDVGRAGVTGFFSAWLLYVLVSLLCYGVMSRSEMADLNNPSVAYVLKAVCGDWAYYFVVVAVIVSLLGGWLAWTLVCAQVPYEAARVGVFPTPFLRLNSKGMPAYGLAVSSIIMQGFLILVVTANDVYMSALTITGMMILPAYLLSGMYLWKTTMHPVELGDPRRRKILRFRFTGICCTFYCLWMIYAGGLQVFMLTSVFYVVGIPFYVLARKEQLRGIPKRRIPGQLFTPGERWLAALLIAGAVSSIALLITGEISF